MAEFTNPVWDYIRDRFTHHDQFRDQWSSRIAAAPPVTPARPVTWSLVGRAIELRIGLDLATTPPYPQLLLALPRPDLERLLHAARYIPLAPDETTSAEDGMPRTLERWQKVDPAKAGTLRARQESAGVDQSVAEQQLTDDCLLLAVVGMSDGARPGDPAPDSPHWLRPDSVAGLRGFSSEADRQDLAVLWQAYQTVGRAQLIALGPLRAVEPVFIRRMAIGDFVFGDTLVDVKATTKPGDAERAVDWVLQQVRYALLDHGDHYRLQQVGLYLARQALLVTWPLEPLLRQLTGDAAVTVRGLRAELREVLERADRDYFFLEPALPRWVTRHPPRSGSPPGGDPRG